MNRVTFSGCLMIGMACLLGLSSGCRRKPSSLTYIPGHTRSITNETASLRDDGSLNLPRDGDPSATNVMGDGTSGIPLPDRNLRENLTEDREFFKASTIYFDFDRSAIRPSERTKVEAVAQALKSRPQSSVEIEGHCDERGTEEYNRALGERRALTTREYLVNLGISGERIFTISYGEDKPAVDGQNQSAWSLNRRGEFILLNPKN